MAVPTHGAFCQTILYESSCWYCEQDIFVLQCTCGSAVLFDDRGPPWPKHSCSGTGDVGGIGGSGLSGWAAVDALRAQGVPITTDVIDRIFPDAQHGEKHAHREQAIHRIEPERHLRRTILAVVRELNQVTNRTKAVNTLPEFGQRLIGLDPTVRYRQITLVDNTVRPNQSFTALIADRQAQYLEIGVMVTVTLTGCVVGNFANWLVNELSPV